MSENVDNLIIRHLRDIRDDVADLKSRVSSVEQAIGDMHQSMSVHSTNLAASMASLQSVVQTSIGQIQVSLGSYHRRTDRVETKVSGLDERVWQNENSIVARLDRIERELKMTGAGVT